jgi:hypothetical protein
MGCFEDGLRNISEPYGGNMPLFNSPNTTDATVTIVSESYDDGMRVTKISTPPRTETRTLIDAIDQALGLVHNLDIGTIDKKDKKKNDSDTHEKGDGENDSIQSKQQQTNKQDWDGSDNGLQKPRRSGSSLSDTEQRMAEED